MKHLNLFTQAACDRYKTERYNLESTELVPEEPATSFKECIVICNDLTRLRELAATYVIIGIPEDLGVRANLGRPGTNDAWDTFLTHFLNLQHQHRNDVHRFCVLGTVHTADLMDACKTLDPTHHKDRIALSEAVKELDNRVTSVIDTIQAAHKIPIIIGGGHNNCYPIIRSFGKQTPIDCINIDAHTDLRAAKGRHSGNGFSHALAQGFLHRYVMVGIQEAYLSAAMLATITAHEDLRHLPHTPERFDAQILAGEALADIDTTHYGLEIDLDVVANFPSSAQSPVGYSFEQLRVLVQGICAQATKRPRYIHICEAAPRYGTAHEVGKALARLVNDFT